MEARTKLYDDLISDAYDFAQRVESLHEKTAVTGEQQEARDAAANCWQAVSRLVKAKRCYESELHRVDSVINRMMAGTTTVDDAHYVESKLKEA